MDTSVFDYVVCGAGTSGCVVAGRLAADPRTRVLLLEAGGSDETELVQDPDRVREALGTELDWGFTAEPNPRLNGRAIPYSMGKVLGGGSSINAAMWSRGHRADWDLYAKEAGDPIWSYASVLELYRHRIEAYAGRPDPEYRGTDGAVHVQSVAEPHPLALALLEAAQAVGLPRFPNANGRMMEEPGGCSFVDENVRDGRRWSMYRAYVQPLLDRPTLTVLTGALVTRILFEGRRATGVEFQRGGRTLQARADREVVLSLGAIHTPKVLMQSGVGDEAELQAAGVPLRHLLPGVGRRLHDHLLFGCIWESKDDSIPIWARNYTANFWKTDPDLDAPNFYAYGFGRPYASPENAARFEPPAASWSLVVGMRPKSRGAVHLTGPAPSDPVRIDPNYLGDPEDLKTLTAGLTTARAMGNAPALAPFLGREVAPGPLAGVELEDFFRDGLLTFWHQSGTAHMGRDPLAVVDGRLRVHGLEALRVADASVLPRVTVGNTMAPSIVVGEQAAAFLGAS